MSKEDFVMQYDADQMRKREATEDARRAYGMDPKRKGRGALSKYRPKTMRNTKRYYKNKEAWARWKELANIDKRITFASALERTGVQHDTLSRWVNGLTDMRFSSAIAFSEAIGCSLDDLGKAAVAAWETMERRLQTEEAMDEARMA
jgi:hypothetical protein